MATAPSPSQQETTKFSQICTNCKVRAGYGVQRTGGYGIGCRV